MRDAAGAQSVGIVGLGIIGLAFASLLRRAGWQVEGCDPAADRRDLATGLGVVTVADPGQIAADLLLTSLPHAAALDAVTTALCGAPRPGRVVADLSTLALADKQAAHDRLAAVGTTLLDCPVSGTGAQAEAGDAVLYVSGAAGGIDRAAPAFAVIARDWHRVGGFGAGMRMKLVANLLVAIHNVAAAEALAFAERLGIDPLAAVGLLADGAGGSRMLAIRGPMMAERRYRPATMKQSVWAKDMQLIAAAAAEAGTPTPLFDVTTTLYARALADSGGDDDTAAVHRLFGAGSG